jgi:tetratricopeptide (TPR) repeat protein
MAATRPLFLACLTGNFDFVYDAFETGKIDKTRINELDPDYKISFFCAALHSGNKNLIHYLFTLGAEPISSLTCSKREQLQFWAKSGLDEAKASSLVDWIEKSYKKSKKSDSQTNPDLTASETAHAYLTLFDIYYDLGQSSIAEGFLGKAFIAFRTIETRNPHDKRSYANCCNSLGLFAIMRGDYDYAKSVYQIAYVELLGLTLFDKSLLEEDSVHRDLAMVCNNLVTVLTLEKNGVAARGWIESAIIYYEKIKHPTENDLLGLMRSYSMLGDMYSKQENDDDTNIEMQNKALALIGKLKNKDQFELLFLIQFNLGQCYERKYTKKLEEIRDMESCVEETFDQDVADDPSEKAREIEQVALIHYLKASLEFAQITRALVIDDLNRLYLCQRLRAVHFLKAGNHQQAENCFQMYLAKAKTLQVLDEQTTRTIASVYNNVGVSQLHQRKFSEAAKSFQAASYFWDSVPVGPHQMDVKKGLLICLDICNRANQGALALVEGYFSGKEKLDLKKYYKVYIQALKIVCTKQSAGLMAELMDCLFPSLTDSFHVFVLRSVGKDADDFCGAFDALQQQLKRENTPPSERQTISYELNKLLTLLFTAADEGNPLLKPDIAALLRDPKERARFKFWQVDDAPSLSSDADSESLPDSDSDADDLLLPSFSIFSQQTTTMLTKKSVPNQERRASSGCC